MIRYLKKEIGWPSFAANPATAKFALAPISVPFPPKQAPRERLHHSSSKSVMPIFPISWIIGIIVATKGMLHDKPPDPIDYN